MNLDYQEKQMEREVPEMSSSNGESKKCLKEPRRRLKYENAPNKDDSKCVQWTKVIMLKVYFRNVKTLQQCQKKIWMQSAALTSTKMHFQSQTYQITTFIFLLVP